MNTLAAWPHKSFTIVHCRRRPSVVVRAHRRPHDPARGSRAGAAHDAAEADFAFPRRIDFSVAAEKRDAPVPQLQQVLGKDLGRQPVVAADMVSAALDPLVEADDWRIELLEHGHHVGPVADVVEHDAGQPHRIHLDRDLLRQLAL